MEVLIAGAITGAVSITVAWLAMRGSIRSAQEQHEPAMVEATQHVLTTTIEALTAELRRRDERLHELEIDNGDLRRQLAEYRRLFGDP